MVKHCFIEIENFRGGVYDTSLQLRVMGGVLGTNDGNMPIIIPNKCHLGMKCSAACLSGEGSKEVVEWFGAYRPDAVVYQEPYR